jgi:Zn-dependent protease with chaperone function
VSARAAARRSELALAALAATALLLGAIVTLDALRFHLPPIAGGARPALDWHSAGLALLLVAEAVGGLRAWRSLRRQASLARRLGALAVIERRRVGASDVRVVADARPLAFCAGNLRPVVYVTDAALERLREDELAAVIAHEAHHARRRDPLRLLVARTLADATGVVGDLPARQIAAADLAADAAAVAATGSARPLASALLRLQDPAPERVDHLLGRPLQAGSRTLLAVTLLATAALVGVAVGLAVAPADPALGPLVVLALAAPSLLACRRPAPAA